MRYMLIQHAFNLLSGIFVGAMVARHYGPELFGVFSLSMFYVTVAGTIASLGANDLLAAQCIKKPEQREGLFWAIFMIRLLTYLICAGLGYFALKAMCVPEIILKGYSIGAVAGLLSNMNLFVVIAKSKQRNDKIAQIAIISLLASIAYRVYIVLTSKDLQHLYYNLMLVGIIDIILIILYLRSGKMIYSFAKPNWPAAFELVRNAAPLAVAAIAFTVSANLGLPLLEKLIDAESAGRYAVVIKLFAFAGFFSHIINNNLFYYMESSGLTAEKFIGQHLRVIVKSAAALSYLVVMGSFFVMSPLLELLYGDQYAGVGIKFSVVSISFVFAWTMIPAQIKLLSEKRTGRIMAVDILGLTFSFAAAYVLISIYGDWGAYLSLPISACMVMLANYYMSGLGKEIKYLVPWFLSPFPSRQALKNFTQH